MKKTTLFAITTVTIAISAFTTLTLWKADEKTSTINFELQGSDKKGTFGNLVTTLQFDAKNLKDSKLTASIDVKTLKAGNEKLENHLKSADYFDVEKFPKISFVSSEIKTTETGYSAKGSLTMKDSTKVIEIPFTFSENDKTKGVFSGTMSVNACDYGVMKANKAGNDKVLVYLVVPVTK